MIKMSKNIRNVFSNLKLTLEYIVDPWNDLVWSILKKVQKNRYGSRFGGGEVKNEIPICDAIAEKSTA